MKTIKTIKTIKTTNLSEKYQLTSDRTKLVGATVIQVEGDFVYFSNGMVMDVNIFSMNLYSEKESSDALKNKKDLSIQRNIRIV